MLAALADRTVETQVLQEGASVTATRKEFGVRFAQYCFHRHLNKLTNTSADDFRNAKPFGTYPFLLKTPPSRSRLLFSFLLCNWRWIERGKCQDYPRQCSPCQKDNTAWHILFECSIFEDVRVRFQSKTNHDFIFEALFIDDKKVTSSAVDAGVRLFQRIAQMCA